MSSKMDDMEVAQIRGVVVDIHDLNDEEWEVEGT